MRTANRKLVFFLWIILMFLTSLTNDFFSIKFFIPIGIVTFCVTVLLGYQISLRVFSLKFVIQLWTILLWIEIFWSIALVKYWNNAKGIFAPFVIFICILCILACIQTHYYHVFFFKICKYIKENTSIMYGILFSVIVRLPQFGTLAKWDAQIYSYCASLAYEKFDFTWRTFFDYFAIATHTSWGYISAYGILEMLFPHKDYTNSLWGLLLSIITLIIIYEIAKKMTEKSNILAALVAVFVTMTPIFAGTYTYFTLDFGIPCFFFALILAYITNCNLWITFFSIILCLIKEPVGIILTAGVIIYNFVRHMNKKCSLREKIRNCIKDEKNYALASGILLFFVGFTLLKVRFSAPFSITAGSGNAIGFFTINIPYIIVKVKQLIFVNFSWLSIGLILILGLYMKKCNIKVDGRIWSVILGTILYTIFMFLYYTYAIPRYSILIYMTINMVAGIFIIASKLKIKSKILILECLIMAFGVQTYFDCDLLMEKVFPTVSTGKSNICNTSITENYLGDYIVYNYKYSYLDNVILQVLVDTGYDGGQDIYILGKDYDSYVGGNKTLAPIFFDKNKKKWTYYKGENSIYVETRDESVLLDDSEEKADDAIIISIPYYQFDGGEAIQNVQIVYDIVDIGRSETFYGDAEYWIARRRTNNE